MNKKLKFGARVIIVTAMIAAIPSCASRVTEIKDPASVIFNTPENFEYIVEDFIPLADINEESDAIRELTLEIFDLCNQEREANGLKKLKWDESLSMAAAKRANELTEDFSHTRPDGSDFYSIFEEIGFSAGVVGENIAIGQKTAEKVMQSWMRSDANKAAILGGYEYIGIGAVKCVGGDYGGYAFVQLFYVP